MGTQYRKAISILSQVGANTTDDQNVALGIRSRVASASQ